MRCSGEGAPSGADDALCRSAYDRTFSRVGLWVFTSTGNAFASAFASAARGDFAAGSSGVPVSGVSQPGAWVTDEWQQVAVLAVAFCAYSAATAVDGSGFVAAWTGGFAFGVALRKGEPTGEAQAKERPADLAEYEGGLLGTLSFPAFGAVLLGPALEHLNWRVITYAVLSLTVVGMLPVALAPAGTRCPAAHRRLRRSVRPPGPGLRLVFGLLMVEDHVPGVGLMGQVVAVTIGLSVLLHGMSAPFFADLYGNWYDAAKAVTLDLREVQGLPEDVGTPHGGSASVCAEPGGPRARPRPPGRAKAAALCPQPARHREPRTPMRVRLSPDAIAAFDQAGGVLTAESRAPPAVGAVRDRCRRPLRARPWRGCGSGVRRRGMGC
ncbi:hypothetical protein SHIRM173S_12086 [Streptomyces hirsutus]